MQGLTVAAAKGLVTAFEQGAGLPVSRTKGQATASKTELAKRIVHKLRGLGCKATRTMKVLGVDTAAGRGNLHGSKRVSLGAMQKRELRMRKLRKAGADVRRIAQPGLVPGTAHGCRVIGMTPAVLRGLKRSMAIALLETAKSASPSMKFQLSDKPKLDPTYLACLYPTQFWSKLAFEGNADTLREMQAAWLKQLPRLGFSKRPWQIVAGPAGATTMVLRKLGRTASSAFHWKLADGTCTDLRSTAPSSVAKFVSRAVEATLWREWASAGSASNELFQRDPGGYWMADLRKLCAGAGKDWSPLQASCLASVVCGSQWGQDRLFLAVYLDSRDCKACRGLHRGTTGHRTWSCKTLQPMREQGIHSEHVSAPREALAVDPNHPFWTRCLLPLSALPAVPPVGSDDLHYFRNGGGGILTGIIFTDGSMKTRWWWQDSQRAAWGAACMAGNSIRLSVGIYGPLPGPDQSVPRAELYVICAILKVTLKPAHIHTDHLNIIHGISHGRAVTTTPKFQNADLWRAFWERLEDLGGIDDELSFTWVPSHQAGLYQQAVGNRWADYLARRGASLHDVSDDDLSTAKKYVKKVYQWRDGLAGRLLSSRRLECRLTGSTSRSGLTDPHSSVDHWPRSEPMPRLPRQERIP